MSHPYISISELYSMKNKRDKSKHNTFNIIIEKCHKKIKNVAEQGGMNIFYEIPFVLIGHPLYNIKECIEYIVDNLRKNGFLVQILPHPNNNTLYISWKVADTNVPKQLAYDNKSKGDNTNLYNKQNNIYNKLYNKM